MRVLLISDADSIHTQRWVPALEGEGCEVHLASFEETAEPGHRFHVLRTFGLGKIGYFFAVPQLRRIATQVRPDIVHAHNVTSYGFLAAQAGLSPLVVTAWGSDVLLAPRKSWILRTFVRIALQRADRITVVAQHMKPAVEELGICGGKVMVLPFGVDLELFPWREPEASHPSRPLRLLCNRGFKPVYDIPTFLRALARLSDRGMDFRASIVGEGPCNAELQAQTKELGLERMVEFPGRKAAAQMAAALAEADIFVSPSLSDGNNISLNEAMAVGTIPVVSSIPANHAWLVDGDTGFFFAPGDHEALAAAIQRALDDQARWREIAVRNREVVEDRANWKKGVGLTVRMYRELARQPQGR